jgi:hypothetical protein
MVVSRESRHAFADISCFDMADDICACLIVALTNSRFALSGPLELDPAAIVLGMGQLT